MTDQKRVKKITTIPSPDKISGRIVEKHALAPDIYELCLAAPETEPAAFLYQPGQYAILSVDGHEPRPYSISGLPQDTALRFHIKDIGHGLSHALVTLPVGSIVNIDFPHGTAVLQEDSNRPMIAIGGGLGLAPLLPIIKIALTEMPEREINLFHGGVSIADLYFDTALRHLSAAHAHLTYTGVSEMPATGSKTGLVSEVAADILPADLSGYDAYLSGAPAMVKACLPPLLAKGLPRDRIFSDAL